MILEILTYPNSVLKKVSQDVVDFDQTLSKLLDDMYETMVESNGIGLAAIQVGVDKNVLIINLPDEEGVQEKINLLELINPVITHREGEVIYQEGCLSVPGYYEDVTRAQQVTVAYKNRAGQDQILEADQLLAIAVQHEMDHLKGKLFIDTFSFTKRKKFDKEWKKEQKKKKK
jgi:peptide deformylase